MNKIRAFTLIELMIVVVIVAIFAAIAFPSYQQYMERQDLAIARQEALRIAAELERFKAKNFSYKGFDASYLYSYTGADADGNPTTASHYDAATGQLLLPIGSTASTAKYTLTLANNGTGYKPLTFAKDSDGNETAASASVNGLSWVMSLQRAKDSSGEPKQPRNYDLLLNSAGVRCMTKVKDVVTSYTDCGGYSEGW
ncbi:prepilin-type N-terminal cleavage/methylation domain-containing protein [Acinetobacter sp. C_4_1]|uniref:type IV pilin protein n=1 Tax=unclassified Acinetobacter TaxID=196816 RepID=UPI0021B7727D|nr:MULTISPECIES: prepilin-type N-terminal cleavage/methylation domain-containing protein [unclassified Acinetobacter]MCT8089493.1 prepilin-type N-terminal cleavage/methylation domain-containing protein [Acinetobacter sp. F_3_1]MCT8098139.1 prepilin-type N-terminal cleavage/methylation domain-containing protein [Acinetobacter sp. C_3_1]MCT8101055.1 prepilin-type N-terminal cleavage/methylation domain-containing protein [Acinetobacter sp. C_4_1]MCT8134806.1 prepilin-type N-terminal cleavage/methy